MANPTKRCPWKVDPDTKVGMVCENDNCMAFDGTLDTCRLLLENKDNVNKKYVDTILAAEINN